MTGSHQKILWATVVFVSACSSHSADSLTFLFSGDITQKRAQASAFSGALGGTFSGSFTYDPTATAIYFGYFPLLAFSIDGHSLNFSNGTGVPFLPGVIVQPPIIPGLAGSIEIRGFNLAAAAADPTDNGSTSLDFEDLSGLVVANQTLPTMLNLSSFSDAQVEGPIFGSSPFPALEDRGVVTELTLAPEPACWQVLLVGLGWILCARRLPRPPKFT